MKSVKQHFNKVYKGERNFMTPFILNYGHLSKTREFELSAGEALFDGDKSIYGVTIIKKVNGEWKPDHDKSKCFHNKKKHLII